mgnify:FL=1
MVNTPRKLMDDPAFDQLREERDAWRCRALGMTVPACRHPDPTPDHVADLPGGVTFVLTEHTTEVRTKRRAAVEA